MTRQYYYKKNSCPATDPFSSACICWHDEGTMCLDHKAMNFLSPVFEDTERGKAFSWRNKPDCSVWQPISTAPKNGTEVLAWIPANTQCMVLAYWPSDGWCDHLTAEEWSPTHWMPLPPPPVD